MMDIQRLLEEHSKYIDSQQFQDMKNNEFILAGKKYKNNFLGGDWHDLNNWVIEEV